MAKDSSSPSKRAAKAKAPAAPAVAPSKVAPSRKPRKSDALGALEPMVKLGRSMVPRCQAMSRRSGKQCGQPSVGGFEVCRMHGAGSPKRVAAGERKPVGAPIKHGLYSKAGVQHIRELADRVREIDMDLDNSDSEMVVLRGTLWYLLEQTDRMNERSEQLEVLLDGLVAAAELVGTLTEQDIRDVQRSVGTGYKLLSMIDSFTSKLLDAGVKIINASKARAETQAKVAETRALDYFLKLAGLVRDIVHEIVPDEDTLDVFEARMSREIYGPLRVAMPERTVN